MQSSVLDKWIKLMDTKAILLFACYLLAGLITEATGVPGKILDNDKGGGAGCCRNKLLLLHFTEFLGPRSRITYIDESSPAGMFISTFALHSSNTSLGR